MFKNIKIEKKLIISFIVVVLMTSISGIIATALLIFTEGNYKEALVVNGFAQGEIGSFNTYLNRSASVIKDTIILSNTDDLQNSKNEYITLQNQTVKAFDDMKANCTTPNEKLLLQEIETKYPKYSEICSQVVELGIQNKSEEAFILFRSQANVLLEEIVLAAQNLVDINIALGNAVSDRLEVQTQWTVFIISVVLLVSFVVSVIFAVFIARSISKPISDCANRLSLLSDGDLKSPVLFIDSKDETGILSRATHRIVGVLNDIISDIEYLLSSMANGNFNINSTVESTYVGDFNAVISSIKKINHKLSSTLSQINQAADQVSSGSDQVSSGAQALSQGATEQASSIESLAATISDISNQIRKNAENSRLAKDKSNEASDEILLSNQKMQEMIKAMDDISNKSSEIGKIIKTIEDIAFQTNILALNAAVEAARAGAAGKGFAVVADEVRNLASKSAEAAKNTTALISQTVFAVENGTKIANDTASSMLTVVEGSKLITNLVDEIAQASGEQALAANQVTQSIDQISMVVQTNSATAEESAAASEELSSQSQVLKSLVDMFELNDTIDIPVKNILTKAATSAFSYSASSKY